MTIETPNSNQALTRTAFRPLQRLLTAGGCSAALTALAALAALALTGCGRSTSGMDAASVAPGPIAAASVPSGSQAPAARANALAALFPSDRDFQLKTPDGKVVHLADVAASHKAVLVNFWQYG
jgi:hypothetical protein